MYNPNDFNYSIFADELTGSESEGAGLYQAHNEAGNAWGRYQFIPGTILETANFLNIPVKTGQDFLNDPAYQDQLFAGYVQIILNYINSHHLDVYLGSSITGQSNGITSNINIYGLVAGAWLGGPGGLYSLLVNNDQGSPDANGTWISDYVAKFSSFDEGSKKKLVSSGNISVSDADLKDLQTQLKTFYDNFNKLFS